VKPNLVICLGNPLMGDDGVACLVAAQLSSSPLLPADTEVTVCGTDLLRAANAIRGRNRVFIVDAALENAAPGTVSVFRLEEGIGPVPSSRHAHGLSPMDTLELLKIAGSSDTVPEFTLITIAVESVRMRDQLSPALAAALPQVTEDLARLLITCAGDRHTQESSA
jgi:hydrogenase maturation protease